MPILTVTLNPALDLSTEVEKVERGLKLRCGPARFDPGGGGVNVSRAIRKLGGDSTAFAAIGGLTGQILKSLLEGEAVGAVWFDLDQMTRQSIMVYERSTGAQYRFVLPGPEWSSALAEAFITKLDETLRNAAPAITHIVTSGSLPPGLPDDFYDSVAERAEELGARVVLDTSGRSLDAAALGKARPPYVWVMDQAEAEQVAGRRLADMKALQDFAMDLRRRDLAQILILTFAGGGAVIASESESFRVTPPKVEVLSKVGAGDSFVAGLVLKLSGGASIREAAAYAMAAATSAVTTPATQLCDRVQTDHYFSMIAID